MAISKSKKPIPEIQKINSKYTIIQLETQESKTNPQSQQQWTKAIPGLEACQHKMPMTTNSVDESTMDHSLSKRQNKPMGKRKSVSLYLRRQRRWRWLNCRVRETW
jgi:hypothetical protein